MILVKTISQYQSPTPTSTIRSYNPSLPPSPHLRPAQALDCQASLSSFAMLFIAHEGTRGNWASQFEFIKADLAADLFDAQVSNISTEHVGSTSALGVVANPIIDILVVILPEGSDDHKWAEFEHVLRRAERQRGYHCIGDG
ncbi:hypothetical protein MMC28_001135 [Mycoblastus sanguinarius]|nr:hypothetical protein [Mycoblastus sanguinarius]